MKQTKHNEVDLLLRSLFRRGKSGSAPGDGAPGEQTLTAHMDADELSSYAEHALPAAARARYTAHLSDCASCRKTVAALSDASGIRVSEQAVEQFGRVSFWHQLTAFFSPQVLRFAIPALAIFAVVGVGLFALRDKQQGEFVAQNQPPSSTTAPTDSRQAGEAARQGTLSDTAASKAKSDEGENAASPRVEKKTASETKEQESKTADSVSESPAVAKDSPGAKSSAGLFGAAQPTFAPEPNASPPPKPESVTVARRAENVAKQREAPAERDERGRQQDEERARAKNETAQVQTTQSNPRPAGALSGVASGNRSTETKRADASADRSGEDKEETRSVSGRRFRRQGSVWVDTAYDASHAVTNISRGSEQFRALVADEPGIRTIAEQLGGEVLLVWKNRAYRIR
jgi:hypothetical protein